MCALLMLLPLLLLLLLLLFDPSTALALEGLELAFALSALETAEPLAPR